MARIAIVDDNAGAVRFASASLRHLGHDLLEIEPDCLSHVLIALHDPAPDLLITDLVMPTCPGQTLIQACREDPHLKDMKILLVTAYGDLKLAPFLQSVGPIPCINKPVGAQVLAHTVTKILEWEPGISAARPSLQGGLLAVVDDSPLTRAYLGACLKGHGYDPLELEPVSLAEVMAWLRRNPPLLLVVDQEMPAFKGDDLIRAIRAEPAAPLRDIPVLMVTGHFDAELEALLHPLKGVEILLKPVQASALMGRIEAMLGL